MPFRKQRRIERVRMPRFALVLLGIAFLALIVYVIAAVSRSFADWYNAGPGAFVRALLAHLTSWLPFSLAEITLFALPVALLVLCVVAYRHYCSSWRQVGVFLCAVLSVFSLVFSLFAFGFGVGYHTTPLEDKIALPETQVNAQTLTQTAEQLVAQLNALVDEISYNGTGFSDMPYDLKEMNESLLVAYEPICTQYPFIQRLDSRVKPVLASKLMSYTHITGVYAYYTGEANINTHFPDYTIPFTAAHELAHQRGVARENEANFIAFLVCTASDDAYVQYSGYLNLYEYVASALYRTDAEAYRAVLAQLDARIVGELRAYSDFFDAYRDSAVSNVSDTVNDTYLKLNGNEQGRASYGLVVQLAVAYYHQ